MSQSYECLYPFILPGVPTSLEYTNSTIYKKDPIKRGKLTFPKLVGTPCIWSHSHSLWNVLYCPSFKNKVQFSQVLFVLINFSVLFVAFEAIT